MEKAENKITKKIAIERLINDFKNNLIAQGYTKIKDIVDDTDKEMAKALKISLTERG